MSFGGSRIPHTTSVATVLYLQFMLHVMLFHTWNMYIYISTLRNICAVSNMADFCSPWISCFPGMLLRYCLSDFEMVPVAPVTTGITLAFTLHMCWISIIRSLYFNIFSASFLITFLSQETAASINMYVLFLLSQIMMSGVLLGIVPSIHACWFHNMVTLPS